EPVFRHRTFPTGKSLLLAIEATKARAFNRHLAAVKANLAFRLAPAMRRSVLAARVSRAARRSRIVFHHLGKCLDSRGKAETFETRRHIRQRFDLDRSRRNRGGCDKSVHGVAFLSWNQHPEPTSSRRATPLLLFQQSPGHRGFLNFPNKINALGDKVHVCPACGFAPEPRNKIVRDDGELVEIRRREVADRLAEAAFYGQLKHCAAGNKEKIWNHLCNVPAMPPTPPVLAWIR